MEEEILDEQQQSTGTQVQSVGVEPKTLSAQGSDIGAAPSSQEEIETPDAKSGPASSHYSSNGDDEEEVENGIDQGISI